MGGDDLGLGDLNASRELSSELLAGGSEEEEEGMHKDEEGPSRSNLLAQLLTQLAPFFCYAHEGEIAFLPRTESRISEKSDGGLEAEAAAAAAPAQDEKSRPSSRDVESTQLKV